MSSTTGKMGSKAAFLSLHLLIIIYPFIYYKPFFFFQFLGYTQQVLRAYFWLRVRVTPGGIEGPFGMLGSNLALPCARQTITLFTVLSLFPEPDFF